MVVEAASSSFATQTYRVFITKMSFVRTLDTFFSLSFANISLSVSRFSALFIYGIFIYIIILHFAFSSRKGLSKTQASILSIDVSW